ncbi:MAG: Hint domain-containing protein [Rhodobacteraceae bacterium]|nr:Hint domain-containing protein [Paracoccaceae bacterium]
MATPDGSVPADRLRPGDRVLTRNDGAQPLHWTGHLRVTGAQARRNPALRPVRVGAGALGCGFPAEDLRLSPDQPVLLSDPRARGLFDAPEVLVRAADLVDGRAIRFEDAPAGVLYVQLLLARHAIVLANGLAVASYHPAHAEPATRITAQGAAQGHAPPPADPAAYGPQVARCLSAGEAALLVA